MAAHAPKNSSYFLWTTLHIFTGEEKQGSSPAFPEAWGQMGRSTDGWHPHPCPWVWWGGHAMAGLTKDLCASPYPDGPRSSWLRQPEICSALPQRSLRSGNVFSFQCGKRTKLYKRFLKMFFIVVIVAIETSGFRLRWLGFSFGFFSAYKLTPENLNTFPWKCYWWGYFTARCSGLDEAAFSNNSDNKSH